MKPEILLLQDGYYPPMLRFCPAPILLSEAGLDLPGALSRRPTAAEDWLIRQRTALKEVWFDASMTATKVGLGWVPAAACWYRLRVALVDARPVTVEMDALRELAYATAIHRLNSRCFRWRPGRNARLVAAPKVTFDHPSL